MGGVTAISLLLSSDILSMRYFKGKTSVSIAAGKSPFKVYFSYNSASVNSPAVEDSDCFNNTISFRSPKDNQDMIPELTGWINKKCIAEVTFSNGVKKIYGTPEIPLLLRFAPTRQGTPEDYNGIEFTLHNMDFAPGRFGQLS